MKNIITLAIFVLCFGCNTEAQDIPDFPFIAATGTATIKVPTETALLSISIEASSKSSATADKLFNDHATKLRELITECGLKANFEPISKNSRWKSISPDGSIQNADEDPFGNDEPFSGGPSTQSSTDLKKNLGNND